MRPKYVTGSYKTFSQHQSTYNNQSECSLSTRQQIASRSSDEQNNGKENLINSDDSWYCKVTVNN